MGVANCRLTLRFEMVKVLPNTFALFEGHKIVNPSAEPLCIHCSAGLVFAACEGCSVEVYALPEVKLIARLRTILPVCALVYNAVSDCILTLERRGPDQPGAARVYSKWRGIMDKDKPQRVAMSLPVGGLSGFLFPPSATQADAEIVELPVENASCIASCSLAPVVAVGIDKTISLFILEREKEDVSVDGEPAALNVTFFLDIRTDMKLKKIAVCGNFVACISTHRVRVIKCMFLGPIDHPWGALHSQTRKDRRGSNCVLQDCHFDHSFIKWSPSLVWEEESRAMSDFGLGVKSTRNIGTESDKKLELEERAGEEDLVEDEDEETDKEEDVDEISGGNSDQDRDQPTPTLSLTFPAQSQQPVCTLNLPFISNAISQAKRDVGRHPIEVLGPVEYVWGQPLTAKLNTSAKKDVKCRVLTMLYRRFPSSGYAYVGADVKGRSATLAGDSHLSERRTGSFGAGVSDVRIGKAGGKGGLHSVELVPTMAEGMCVYVLASSPGQNFCVCNATLWYGWTDVQKIKSGIHCRCITAHVLSFTNNLGNQ